MKDKLVHMFSSRRWPNIIQRQRRLTDGDGGDSGGVEGAKEW